jgi:uncharacterized protein
MKQYKPPFILFNNHFETVYPSVFRNVALVKSYVRERITTPDHDFLDLDWIENHSSKLVIISHGLEGNSTRAYVLGMANIFATSGYDVLAWNYRGCGEEINKQLRFYHSGATYDLDTVVQHAINMDRYNEIYLVGFSLGGNLTLKYLGERTAHPLIKKAATFSVPLDLHSSCQQLSKPSNAIYSMRFLRSLKAKIVAKAEQFKELDVSSLAGIKSLIEFDDSYTAPLHGFASALDYYSKCSALPFLPAIAVPTLIVNAKNDPFLSPACYPTQVVKGPRFVQVELPERGGHVGFALFNKNGAYWSELRALTFVTHA